MFAFNDFPDEQIRIKDWKVNDPISLQDAYNTSDAFLAACKANDLEEIKAVVDNAIADDFLQYYVIQGYYAIVQHLNFDAFIEIFDAQDFPFREFPEIAHAVCELCKKETFDVCRKFLRKLYWKYALDIDYPRFKDGATVLCVSCMTGCLPLSVILIEDFKASCNVITKKNLTPYQLNAFEIPEEDELTKEGRKLFRNRMESMGIGRNAMEVLRKLRNPASSQNFMGLGGAGTASKPRYKSWSGGTNQTEGTTCTEIEKKELKTLASKSMSKSSNMSSSGAKMPCGTQEGIPEESKGKKLISFAESDTMCLAEISGGDGANASKKKVELVSTSAEADLITED